MRIKLTLFISLILIFSTFTPTHAEDLEPQTPVEAVQGFFNSLHEKDVVQAWKLLTDHSQRKILNHLEDELRHVFASQRTANAIEQASTVLKGWFKRGDEQIIKHFWKPFAKELHLRDWMKQKFTLRAKVNPKEAIVGIHSGHKMKLLTFMNNHYAYVRDDEISLKAYKVNHTWKFGYIETIESLPHHKKKHEGTWY